MNSRIFVTNLIVLFVFTCCQSQFKSNKKLNNSLDDTIGKCIVSNLSDGTQDVYTASLAVEKYLLKNNYLLGNSKKNYKKLIFLLLKNKIKLDKKKYRELENELILILSPSTLSVINYCFKNNIKNKKNNSLYATDIAFYKLLDEQIKLGDLGNPRIVNEYFNLLSNDDFNKPAYKIFIIHLICRIWIEEK